MSAGTIEVGPNLLAVVIALIAFATTVFNTLYARKVNKEMKPNGGSSLRDAVNRIEQHTAATTAAVNPDAAKFLPPPPPPKP